MADGGGRAQPLPRRRRRRAISNANMSTLYYSALRSGLLQTRSYRSLAMGYKQSRSYEQHVLSVLLLLLRATLRP
eukprot:3820527-Rhodomonas_salina.2